MSVLRVIFHLLTSGIILAGKTFSNSTTSVTPKCTTQLLIPNPAIESAQENLTISIPKISVIVVQFDNFESVKNGSHMTLKHPDLVSTRATIYMDCYNNTQGTEVMVYMIDSKTPCDFNSENYSKVIYDLSQRKLFLEYTNILCVNNTTSMIVTDLFKRWQDSRNSGSQFNVIVFPLSSHIQLLESNIYMDIEYRTYCKY